MKRGQLAMFIIMGFLALIVVVLLLVILKYVSGQNLQATGEIGGASKDVSGFTQECLEQMANEAVLLSGLVGGRVFEKYVIFDEDYTVPYFDPSVDYSKDKFETLIKNYVEANYLDCIDGYKNFPGYKVNQGEISADVKIRPKNVEVTLNNPTSLQKGSRSFEFDIMKVGINVRLSDMLQYSKVTVDEIEKGVIPWNFFTELGDNGFSATAYSVGEDSLVVRFVDEENKLMGEPYVFQFAARIE